MKALLFDLDGTLINSYDAHSEAWVQCCLKRGIILAESAILRTFGCHNSEIIPIYWQEAGLKVPSDDEMSKIAAEKESLFRSIATQDFPEVEGSRELLRQVSDLRFFTAIASNAPRENVVFCSESFFPHHFDALVSGDDVARGKPDPEIFLTAAERLKIKPNECLVIEDSPAGVEAARVANMKVIAIRNPAFESDRLENADLVVDKLADITVRQLQSLFRC